MNRQPSAVLASVFAAHDGPSGAKVCAQSTLGGSIPWLMRSRETGPGLCVELASTGLCGAASPLLKEERCIGAPAGVSNVPSPPRVHGPSPRTAFASNDHPRDPGEVQVDWAE